MKTLLPDVRDLTTEENQILCAALSDPIIHRWVQVLEHNINTKVIASVGAISSLPLEQAYRSSGIAIGQQEVLQLLISAVHAAQPKS